MPAPERIPPRGGMSPGRLLATGELTVVGHIREASNAVLYATVSADGESLPCVYKPTAGERPLWDFPDGTLARREVAAFEVCRALGWDLVPHTVLRDGPYGEGMCQQWQGPLPDDPEPERTAADGLLALVGTPEAGPGWKAVGVVALGDEDGGADDSGNTNEVGDGEDGATARGGA
ncbi:protein kinase family protein, partial [Streptomyces sparsus]